MNVITKRTIIYYTEQYPQAKNQLLNWLKEFESASFNSFNELKEKHRNASVVAKHRIIFNIKGNSFRLIISINFHTKAAYVIWFGSHEEYDNIDVAAIPYIRI